MLSKISILKNLTNVKFLDRFEALPILNFLDKNLSNSVYSKHLNTKSLGLRFFYVERFKRFFIDLGFSHYCLLKIPSNLRLVAKKKNLYLITEDLSSLTKFVFLIWRLKKFSVYKNKSLIPYSRVKYLKLKLGKKKQI